MIIWGCKRIIFHEKCCSWSYEALCLFRFRNWKIAHLLNKITLIRIQFEMVQVNSGTVNSVYETQ